MRAHVEEISRILPVVLVSSVDIASDADNLTVFLFFNGRCWTGGWVVTSDVNKDSSESNFRDSPMSVCYIIFLNIFAHGTCFAFYFLASYVRP